MDQFSRCAFSSTAWDAIFVSLAVAILIYAFSFDPALALKIGAFVALAFCLSLIHRLSKLHKEGVCQTEIWQVLEPHELPYGAQAIQHAHERMEEILMRFAKGASGAAGTLFAAALLVSLN